MNEENIDFESGIPRLLKWLLAIIGCGLMVATFAVFLPESAMATIHEWLRLGDFPGIGDPDASPITLYLARSTSLLYAVHGSLMLIVSMNMKRYWPLVLVFGWLHVVIGLVMFGIDLTAPMPLYWIAGEGIPIALAGLLIVVMWKKADIGEPLKTPNTPN